MKNLKSTKSRVIMSLALLILLAGLIPTLGIFSGGRQSVKASDVTFTTFPLPNGARSITNGPDGNLWFTNYYANNIGRSTLSGAVTEFPMSSTNDRPFNITSGPDGNLWFTEDIGNKIGRITPTGVITEFTLPTTYNTTWGITSGPDGNIWFTENNNGTDLSQLGKIGRITPAGVITEFPVSSTYSPGLSNRLFGITTGPDGNLWFTEWDNGMIGRITPSGVITEFGVPTGYPDDIITGPDGNLWFTEALGDKIGRITPSGTSIDFSLPTTGSYPDAITNGPDGNLWFTELDGRKVGRITTSGVITEFSQFIFNSNSYNITPGADGNLWFTTLDYSPDGSISFSLVKANLSGFTPTTTPILTPTPTSTPTSTPTPAPVSNGNIWSGYVATGDFSHSTVHARAIVPSVKCDVKGDIAIWIGYDGVSDNSVEQDGFTVSCDKVDGQPSYQLWYENYKGPILQSGIFTNSCPSKKHPLPICLSTTKIGQVNVAPKLSSKLQPGDAIDMFAARIPGGGRPGQTDSIFYSLSAYTPAGVKIDSWSQTVGEPVFMAPKYSSSECIIEHEPLPKFDTITFQGCSAIDSGDPLTRLYMSNGSDVLTSVDNYTVNSNGLNQFQIHYLRSN